MIIYCTKYTLDMYDIGLPDNATSFTQRKSLRKIIQNESNDDLLKWGAKIFYFDGRMCLQLINFASQLRIFLMDFKYENLEHCGNAMVIYLLDIYKDNNEMIDLLRRLFEESETVIFDKLSNMSITAMLNHAEHKMQSYKTFYDFISDGIFHTKELNRFVNEHFISKSIGYKTPCEFFEELLKERYKGGKTHGKASANYNNAT